MEAKYKTYIIFGIILLLISPVFIPGADLWANESSKYLDAVREFADNVLKYGRDTYGPKHTPLFVDGLMVRDPNNPNYGKDGVFKPVEWIAPNGDRWILSNLASQQNLFRTLDGLTRITGDPKYKQAAMDAIKYAFENLRSPNGLLYWGGHEAYDAGADRPCGRMIHELKSNLPYYELMWEVDPQATRQFIEAFWSGHIRNWSNLDMSRQFNMNTTRRFNKPWDYEYQGGPVFFESQAPGVCFFSSGSELFVAAAVLSKLSSKGEPLVWAKRLIHRYIETRNPITGISAYVYTSRTKTPTLQEVKAQGYLSGSDSFFPFCPTLGDSDVRRCTYAYCTVSPGIPFNLAMSPWIRALLVGETMGSDSKEFIQWSIEELTAVAKMAYRKSDNSWIPMLRDGTSLEGLVVKKTGFGPEGTVIEPIAAIPMDFWAYTLAYRLTGNEFMWEMARNIALGNGFGDIGVDPTSLIELKHSFDCADPYALLGFLELYKKTQRDFFLRYAEQIGNNILYNRFYQGFFLPSSKHIYTRLNSPESLALIHLYVASKSCQAEVPTMWPASPFFEHVYRYKDQIDDTGLIYTLTDSPEPSISLQEAAHTGNVNLINSLLENGVDVDAREDSFYKTALHRAVLSGQKSVVELLLSKGANINAQDSASNTPLHMVANNGDKEVAELLIVNGADVNAENSRFGDTPLQYAAYADNKDIIELLLKKGATIANLHIASYMGDLEKAEAFIRGGTDINALDGHGYAPLHYAVQNSQKEIIELLISKGADVNVENWQGQSPVYIAVNRGHKDIAELLISKGADVNIADNTGKTPLHRVAEKGQRDIVDLLISKGADINIKDNDGKTVLDIAMENYNQDLAKLLIANGAEVSSIFVAAAIGDLAKVKAFLQKGVDINTKGTRGQRALHTAAREGNKEVVEFLLENGADVNAGMNLNRTAAELAMDNNHSDIVELFISKGADISPLHLAISMKDEVRARSLIEAGADVNKRTQYGTSPLHTAVDAGLKNIVELLIEKGADINAKNNWSWTPLNIAINNSNTIAELKGVVVKDMVELLVAEGADVNTKSGSGLSPLSYAIENGNTEIAEILRKHGAKE